MSKKLNEKQKNILDDLDKYSRAIPCGTALLAIEEYTTRKKIQNLKEQSKTELARLYLDKKDSENVNAEVKKLRQLVNIRYAAHKLEGQFHSIRILRPKKDNINQDYTVLLPLTVLQFMKKSSKERFSECFVKKAQERGEDFFKYDPFLESEQCFAACSDECDSRDCLLKKWIRYISAHELAHVIDDFTGYSEGENANEDFFNEISKEIVQRREAYLEKSIRSSKDKYRS